MLYVLGVVVAFCLLGWLWCVVSTFVIRRTSQLLREERAVSAALRASANDWQLYATSLAAGLTSHATLHLLPDGRNGEHILDICSSAKKSLHVLIYNFSSARILTALISASRSGVAVRCVFDAGMVASDKSTRAAVEELASAGVLCQLSAQRQHAKVIIADGLHVVVGSANWSDAALLGKNIEAMVVFQSVPDVARLMDERFDVIWAACQQAKEPQRWERRGHGSRWDKW